MPLFKIDDADGFVPLRRVQAGPESYEEELEALIWSNLDAFVGVSLFPVARQPILDGEVRPSIVALDEYGHVSVIEIKRNVDRSQLAQCMEYAGWARNTSLGELAGLYHSGAEAFSAAWAKFTKTDSPRLLQRPPQLVLVGRDFDDRADAALSYLTENDPSITVLRITVYEDHDGRRYVNVGADHEFEILAPVGRGDAQPTPTDCKIPIRHKIDGRKIKVLDLIDAGLLAAGETLTWSRPQLRVSYWARVLETGLIELAGGLTYPSPSDAAKAAANGISYNGWKAWRTDAGDSLADLRERLADNGSAIELG